MVPRPAELPREFADHPFSTRSAIRAGISPDRLRARDLEAPFRGVRRTKGTTDSLRTRCIALATRLPRDAVFVGPTAARLLGIPLPSALEREDLFHVAVAPPRRAVRVEGIRARTLQLAPFEIRDWLDVRITSPARTWRDLAEHLSLWDLVAAGDAVLHGRRPMATRPRLEEAVERAVGARGVRLLRAALPLLDAGAESRRESHLRLALIAGGLTGFVSNHPVQLPGSGIRYRIDIAFPEVMLGIEYQGSYHHDEEQWRKDMTRLSRLRAEGWRMVEVSKDDLADPGELAHRIQLLVNQRAS